MAFFAVKEHLEQDFIVIVAPEEDKMHVCPHGNLPTLEDLLYLFRGLRHPAETLQTKTHHQGHEGVVMGKTQISSTLAYLEVGFGPGNNVLDYGIVTGVLGPGLRKELIIIYTPKGDSFFVRVKVHKIEVRVKAVHALGKEEHMGGKFVELSRIHRLAGLLEEAGQYLLRAE